MLQHPHGSSGERRSVDLNGLIQEALNLPYHGTRAQDASFSITLERDFADAIAPIELVPQDITRVCSATAFTLRPSVRRREATLSTSRPSR
jgi:hypothetical protein